MKENKTVNGFKGEYEFLSNFYPCRIEYEGLYYLNSEAAFQAQKCTNEEEKRTFCELTAVKAKQHGRRVSLRPDWNEIRLDVMEKVLRAKFTGSPQLAQKLIKTGNITLVEYNTWKDTFWGVDVKLGGENNLGKLLMKIRSELKEK